MSLVTALTPKHASVAGVTSPERVTDLSLTLSSTLTQVSGPPSASTLEVVSPILLSLVNTGIQGPPGLAAGALAQVPASVALSGHQVIAVNALGEAVYASADDPAQVGKVLGISTSAAIAGALLPVQSKDVLEFAGWSWVPDSVVMLGLNGALVSTLPPGAVFLQVVGRALSATRILVGVQPPIYL